MTDQPVIQKRGRGRPKKISALDNSVPINAVQVSEPSVPRKRGRPKKTETVPTISEPNIRENHDIVNPIDVDDSLEITSSVDLKGLSQPVQPEKKRRGRPPIDKTKSIETDQIKESKSDEIDTIPSKTIVWGDSTPIGKPVLKEYKSQPPSLHGFANFNTMSVFTWVIHNGILSKVANDLNRQDDMAMKDKVEKIKTTASQLIPEHYTDRNIFISSFNNEIDWESVLLRCKNNHV